MINKRLRRFEAYTVIDLAYQFSNGETSYLRASERCIPFWKKAESEGRDRCLEAYKNAHVPTRLPRLRHLQLLIFETPHSFRSRPSSATHLQSV